MNRGSRDQIVIVGRLTKPINGNEGFVVLAFPSTLFGSGAQLFHGFGGDGKLDRPGDVVASATGEQHKDGRTDGHDPDRGPVGEWGGGGKKTAPPTRPRGRGPPARGVGCAPNKPLPS